MIEMIPLVVVIFIIAAFGWYLSTLPNEDKKDKKDPGKTTIDNTRKLDDKKHASTTPHT